MSIKQNFPTIDSSLNLDFAGSRVVDSRITFTRASAATVTDANGIIQTIRDNKSRIDFDGNTGECKGLLLEEGRTNLMKCSDRISSYTNSVHGFVAVTVIPFATTAPDSTFSATSLLETAATDKHCIQNGFTQGTAGYYTVSLYVKPNGRTKITLREEYSYGGDIDFDLSTQTATAGSGFWISSSGRIQSLTNGWYRISATINLSTANNYCVFDVIANSGSATSYAGDITKGFYVWGFQIEQGSFVTSYVSTTPGLTSRASSATYFDSTGVLRTAPTNSARYGYGYDTTTQKWIQQGLIFEAAATNLYSDSNGLLTSLSNATASISTVLGPDAATYAQQVQVSGNYVYRYFPSVLGGNATHTWSFFVKPVNNLFKFANGGTPGSFQYYFDFTPSTPTVSFAGSGFTNLGTTIISVGNSGWWRVSCTVNGTGTAGYMEAQWSYGGSGTANFYIWGVQCETGTVATSYIPTTSSGTATRAADVAATATVTRAAETAKIAGNWFAPIYNKINSTLLIDSSLPDLRAVDRYVATITDSGMTTNAIHMRTYNTTSAWQSYTQSTNNASPTGTVAAGNIRVAGSINAAGMSLSTNGSAVSSSGAFTMPVLSNPMLLIGSDTNGTNFCNGWIKRISYYPIKVTSTQLQALTV